MSRVHRWLSPLVCVLAPLALTADELPPRAVARLGDYRFYHGYVEHAAMTADGRWLASAGMTLDHPHNTTEDLNEAASIILIWDSKTGQRLRELHAPKPVNCLAFSPDGAALAVGCGFRGKDFTVAVIDRITGKLLHELTDFDKPISHVQFSTDGKRLHVSELEGAVSAWDADTAKRLHLWQLPKAPPGDKERKGLSEVLHQGILSPNGQVVAWVFEEVMDKRTRSGCCTLLRVCDADSGKLLYQKHDDKVDFTSLLLSADGKRYAASDQDLVVWHALSGDEVRRLRMTSRRSRIRALSADYSLAAVDADPLQLWNLKTGEWKHDLCGTGSGEHSAAFSADGKMLMTTDRSILRLWNTASGQELLSTPGHRQEIEALSFSPDSKSLVSISRDLVCRWDVSRGKETDRSSHRQPGAENWFVRAAYSPDRRFFIDQLTLPSLLFRSLPVPEEMKSYQNQLRLRESATDRVVYELEGNPKQIVYGAAQCLFSQDGSRLLTVVCLKEPKQFQQPDDLLYQVHDVATGKQLCRFRAKNATYVTAFAANGRSFAWVDGDLKIHVHDATTGRLLHTMKPSEDHFPLFQQPNPLVLSPDGSYVALIPAGGLAFSSPPPPVPVHIYHVETGREVLSVQLHNTTTWLFQFSPDNRLLAVTDQLNKRIRLIEIATGRTRFRFEGHRDDTRCLAFSPDGRTLATGGADNVVYLWDVTGARAKRPAHETGSPEELTTWWNALANTDAEAAGQALAALLRWPERSVPFFKERLSPAEPVDAKHIVALIATLNDDAFEKREAAGRELARLDERAETALRQALKNEPPPEAKRRIIDLLEKLDPHTLSPETLRLSRAIEVLEHLGTPEARRLLEALAKGAPEARLTREAQASLKRLEKQEQR